MLPTHFYELSILKLLTCASYMWGNWKIIYTQDWPVVPKAWPEDPLEDSGYFRNLPGQMIFINTIYVFTVITFALTVGETTGTLVRIKREALKCSNSHCILHCSALTVIKVSVTLKNTLNEVWKIIDFIKFQHLSWCYF